jgi:glycerol-3-phosphate acyltransferase PlsX
VLRTLAKSLDPRQYNGASLVGLNGIVIKSHGGADVVAFEQALETALIEVEKGVPEKIHELQEPVISRRRKFLAMRISKNWSIRRTNGSGVAAA